MGLFITLSLSLHVLLVLGQILGLVVEGLLDLGPPASESPARGAEDQQGDDKSRDGDQIPPPSHVERRRTTEGWEKRPGFRKVFSRVIPRSGGRRKTI